MLMNISPFHHYLYKQQNRFTDMKTIEINGTLREETGSKSAKTAIKTIDKDIEYYRKGNSNDRYSREHFNESIP